MASCTFFGHRECYGLDAQALCYAIENLIIRGVDSFYIGNQGQFDSSVYSCLKQLRKDHHHIRVCVLFLSMPIVLGSVYSFLIFLAYPFIIAKRIKYEEEFLEEELDGYREYKQKVKYRLIPFIW